MRCSNCGKNMPAQGNVCPWCEIDKKPDQIRANCLKIGTFVGSALGLFIGARSGNYFFGIVIGMVLGFFQGGLIGDYFFEQYKSDIFRKNSQDEKERMR